jgi:hypothetical protein
LRNVAGITGIGLLSAAVLGGALAWAGPMAYLVLTETALAGNVTTPLDLASPAAARRGRGALRGGRLRRRSPARHGARHPRVRPRLARSFPAEGPDIGVD